MSRDINLIASSDPFDFSYLSKRNAEFNKRSVQVMNGAVFLVLDIPLKTALKISNILYLHVHRGSGRCYVGITIMTAQMRWGNGNPYRNNPRFGNAIKKYGWDDFDSYIIAIADDRDDLNNAEITAISVAGGHKSKLTFNLSPGGDAVSDTSKPIVGLNLTTGESVWFKSSSEVARELGFTNPDRAAAVARGALKTTAGWWFRFEDDVDASPPAVWGEEARLDAVRAKQGKSVIAINLESGEKRKYQTTNAAAKSLGMTQSVISLVALGQVKSSKGWWFKYEGDPSEPPVVYGTALARITRDQEVFATNLDSGERRSFRNCTVADRELGIYKGGAAMVCSGERTSAAGWWFSYHSDAKAPTEFKGALVAKARSKPIVARCLETNQEEIFASAKSASEKLGLSRSVISLVLNGKRESSAGYIFRFLDK